MQLTQLNAPIVYSGLGTAQRDACIVLQHLPAEDARHAHIVFIGSQAEARLRFASAAQQYSHEALCPRLVNAHTHLDLSHMPYAESAYDAFVARVIAHSRAGKRGLEAAQHGLQALQQSEVQTFGDIVTDESTMRWLLQREGVQGVAYWEVIGIDAAQSDTIFTETVARLRSFKRLEHNNGLRLGISPHTPHTVSAPLLRKLAAFAQHHQLPMQIHVAESPQESQWHQGQGTLLAAMRHLLPADWQPSGTSPVQYLATLGVLAARPTLVHMVQVDDEDVRLVQKYGCPVVHCPRSNLALGCGVFPWQLYQKHGVDVALGTDSSGSAPSLSIQEECLAAQQMHPQLSRRDMVRAVVKGGHRALHLKPPQLVRGSPAHAIASLPLLPSGD